MVAVHRRHEVEDPRPKFGITDTIGISRQSKERKDRGNSDELEQAVEKDQAKDGKELQPPVGKCQAVAAGEEFEEGGEHYRKA